MELSPSQKSALVSLQPGPGNIPAVHTGKLSAAGLVELTGEGSGRRGYANVRLTDAGRAALA
jgi:hypothetical protein